MTRKKQTALATVENEHVSSPGKLTPALLSRVCSNYAQGISVQESCDAEHISSVAFHRYRALHPDFESGEWAEAERMNTAWLEDKAARLAATADNRSPTMIIFMLKARRPGKYRDNAQVTNNLNIGRITTISSIKDAELRERSMLAPIEGELVE